MNTSVVKHISFEYSKADSITIYRHTDGSWWLENYQGQGELVYDRLARLSQSTFDKIINSSRVPNDATEESPMTMTLYGPQFHNAALTYGAAITTKVMPAW